MRVLIHSGAALEKINGNFYAGESWYRMAQWLASNFKQLTLWVPVREHPRSSPVPTDKWRVNTENMRVVALDYFNSYASCYKLWPWRIRAWKREIRQLLQEHDVLVVRTPTPLVSLVCWAAYQSNKPLAVTVVGDMLGQSDRIIGNRGIKKLLYFLAGKFLAWQETKSLLNADKIWVYTKEIAARHHRNPSVKILEIPFLSEQDFVYREDTCQKLPIRLLRASWLLPSKGLEYLLETMAILRKRSRSVFLEIVGKERTNKGYQNQLIQLINHLGISDCVAFSGWVPYDKLDQVYLRNDIQVISSLAEGTPRCLAEGLARGLPVVTTAIDGCQETLVHEENALLVPPANPEALARAIERLIDDGKLRRHLIMQGYKRAQLATFEHAGVEYLRDLRQAVQRRQGS